MVRQPRTSTVLCVWLLVFSLGTWPSVAASQEERYQSVQPTQDELPAVAARLREASRELAGIWPGFWSADESFLLLSPQGGMLLIASGAPPSEYSPLSPAHAMLAGRAYTREGALPGMRPGTFPGTVDVAGQKIYALPPMGATVFKRVSFYVHEAFHYYQRHESTPWTATPEDTIMGLSPRAALRDPSVVNDSAFRAALRRENEMLARMVTLHADGPLLNTLRSYLELRSERLRGREDVLAVERRYERREGTAEYVGCRAAALAFGSRDTVSSCLVENLTEDEPEDPVMQFLRWRPYSVGAILSLVLDRLEVANWKDAVAAGEHLDVIASRAVREQRQRPDRPGADEALGDNAVRPGFTSLMASLLPGACDPVQYDVISYLKGGLPVAKAKVAVTLDARTLRRVDRLVRDARFPNRSQAIEAAIAEQLDRLERRRLVEECGKLDPAAERALAEEGLGADATEWPEY